MQKPKRVQSWSFCCLVFLGIVLPFKLLMSQASRVLNPGKNLQPQHLIEKVKWRSIPSDIESTVMEASLKPLLKGKTVNWETGTRGEVDFRIQFSNDDINRDSVFSLLTYSVIPQCEVHLEIAAPDNDSNTAWMELESSPSGPFLNKIEFRPLAKRWYRVRFEALDTLPIRVWNLGLYEPRAGQKNDYWVALGASIQNQSMRQACFAPEIKRLFGGADPIMFNLAVPGWRSEDLLRNLPFFLEQHPHATYFCIHIGGNNVSQERPFPKGAGTLRRDLDKVIQILLEAGKIPILATLSFRAYKQGAPVPPESNGSGPYVTHIYNPLAKNMCRNQLACRDTIGVDMYRFTKSNTKYLRADGIHLNPLGEKEWCHQWARSAGRIVYQQAQIRLSEKNTRLNFRWPRDTVAVFQAIQDVNNTASISESPKTLVSDLSTKLLNKALKPKNVLWIQSSKGKKIIRQSYSSGSAVTWNFKNSEGKLVESGLYDFRLSLGKKSYSGRILFLR